MAPDDLKFVRMEPRLHEQQLIMAELGQAGHRDGKHAKAITGVGQQKREDPTMIAKIGAAANAGGGSEGGGGGGGDTRHYHEFKDAATPMKPFALAGQFQKYGSCEPTRKTEVNNNGNNINNNSRNQTANSNEASIEAGDNCGVPARQKEALDGSRPAGATIGGNKFAELPNMAAVSPDGGGAGDPNHDIEVALKNKKSFESWGENDDKQPKKCVIQRLAKVIPCFGILLSLCASLFLGTAGMLVKLIDSVHGIEVAVFRAVIQLVIYSSIITIRRINWTPRREELLPVAMRAIFGGVSITFSYYALKLIPLGDASTIRFSLPIWTLIMSYFFLNESCSLYKMLAVFISISGVTLVTKPDDCTYVLHWLLKLLFNYEIASDALLVSSSDKNDPPIGGDSMRNIEKIALLVRSPPPLSVASTGRLSAQSANLSQVTLLQMGGAENNYSDHARGAVSPQTAAGQLHGEPNADFGLPMVVGAAYSDPLRQFEGCLMALASSVCLAMSIVALRMCKQTPSEVTILWLSMSSVAVGSLTLVILNEWTLPDNFHDLLFIFLNGICGSLGQWFMTNALKVEQSGLIALARTFDIEVAFLYSAFLLGEQIRITSVLGSILVTLGVIIVLVPRWLGCGHQEREDEDEDDDDDAHRTTSNTDASSIGASNDGDRSSRQETTTTVLNGHSSDARRSSADARSIECLKRRLEKTYPSPKSPQMQHAGAASQDLPGKPLV